MFTKDREKAKQRALRYENAYYKYAKIADHCATEMKHHYAGDRIYVWYEEQEKRNRELAARNWKKLKEEKEYL